MRQNWHSNIHIHCRSLVISTSIKSGGAHTSILSEMMGSRGEHVNHYTTDAVRSKLDLQLPVQSVPITTNVGVRTPFMVRCYRCNIMWYSLSVTCGRSVVFSLYSTNKTDSNDITDILLKMALSTINQTKQILACHNIIDITKISQCITI
jgi:hypothetical protein